ncbi:MAG TPA: hypothetical protein VJS43_16980 [Candidatus Acidoferrales bacterium]|nr:hypothetical protein [Candidatus Acidoferrales bacterium]
MSKRTVNRLWNRLGTGVGLAVAAAALLAAVVSARPKHKKETVLPDFVWQARSVAVVILPDSPEPANDPLANHKAQENVEDAFLKWGRFRLEQERSVADLIIAVRKGSGKLATPTISHGPMDSPPGTIEATDDTIRIGVKTRGTAAAEPVPGVEVGAADDLLEVFQAGSDAPIWKYSAKDALKAPGMPAVGKFREAVEEAEQAAKKQQPQPAQKKAP